ncbi:hypothetical protein C0991_009686, partial [Blastosporella zonata]
QKREAERERTQQALQQAVNQEREAGQQALNQERKRAADEIAQLKAQLAKASGVSSSPPRMR